MTFCMTSRTVQIKLGSYSIYWDIDTIFIILALYMYIRNTVTIIFDLSKNGGPCIKCVVIPVVKGYFFTRRRILLSSTTVVFRGLPGLLVLLLLVFFLFKNVPNR